MPSWTTASALEFLSLSLSLSLLALSLVLYMYLLERRAASRSCPLSEHLPTLTSFPSTSRNFRLYSRKLWREFEWPPPRVVPLIRLLSLVRLSCPNFPLIFPNLLP